MWKYTRYLKVGLSHEAAGTKCQDSVTVKEDENGIVAALADGLGSLEHSDVAANTATNALCALLLGLGKTRLTLESQERKQAFGAGLVRNVAAQVREKAAQLGLAPRDMDCTLVFVYISKIYHYALVGRLGDSAICVIKEQDSIALNDGNSSANGTCALLDKDAEDHMQIWQWEIAREQILGFILSSDGLDNELYRKGSDHVNKAAEDYFNAIVTAADPQTVIARKVAELTAEPDSAFDDDISVAVISRAKYPITLAKDPTWLCTCGERNRLQDTYCAQCGKDFSILYQNVRFREHGGKAAFFARINGQPEEERKILGLTPEATAPVAPVSAPVAPAPAAPVVPKAVPAPTPAAPAAPVSVPPAPAPKAAQPDFEIEVGEARPRTVKPPVPVSQASQSPAPKAKPFPKGLFLGLIALAVVVSFVLGGIVVGTLISRRGKQEDRDDKYEQMTGAVEDAATESAELQPSAAPEAEEIPDIMPETPAEEMPELPDFPAEPEDILPLLPREPEEDLPPIDSELVTEPPEI